MIKPVYTIPQNDTVVAHGFVPLAWVLHDRPALDTPAAQQKYFTHGYAIFREKLDAFANAGTAPTAAQERELLFMLQALIEAKHRLQPIAA
jgi:hypothetical protein